MPDDSASEALVNEAALNTCKKVFIQRDYSRGLAPVCFYNDYPDELNGKISRETWNNFINSLNQIYAEAESLNMLSTAEAVISFISCNLSRLCVGSVWKKKLGEVEILLEESNKNIFVKRGVFVFDPVDKGLRVIEIALLDEPMPAPPPPLPQHNHSGVNPLQPR